MSLTHRFRSAALFVGVLYFTFIGGSFYTDFNFPLRLVHQALVTVLLGGWLIGLLWRREPWPHTALDWPIVIWLAASAISASLGLSPRYSWEGLWNAGALALGFYLLVDLKRRGQAGSFVRSLYLASAVVCLLALVEWFCWYFGVPLVPAFVQGWPEATGWTNLWPPYIYRVGLPMNGPTPLSAYLALLIPPAVVLRFACPRKDDRQALTVWLVLAGVVEILSFSRGGLLALMVSLPLLGLGWFAVHVKPEKIRAVLTRRAGRWALGASLLAALAALALGGWWFNHTFSGRQGSTEFRFTLWKVAVTLFAERPVTGVGPYNFGRALLLRNDPALPRQQVTTPHNLYLDTAAELGLLGLAAGAALLFCAGWACWRRWQAARASPRERMFVAAAGAALVGFGAQSLVDTFLAWPVLVPVLALAAYGLTDSRDRPADSRRQGWSRTALAALAGLVAYSFVLAWVARADAHFEASVSAMQQGRLDLAVQEAQQAVDVDPGWPLYLFQLAYVEGRSGQPESVAAAAQHYRQGLALEPVDGINAANLSSMLWQQGARAEAMAEMEQALQVEPYPVYLANLGYFYEAAGRESEATTMYAKLLLQLPDLAGSEFWQAEAQRARLWPEIMRQVDLALASLPTSEQARWRMTAALARGDWPSVDAQARTILALVPADYGASLALAQAAVHAGQYAEASRLASIALSAYPASGRAYWVQGVIDQAQGDLVGAERNWRKALFLGEPLGYDGLGELALARGDVAAAQRYQAAWRKAANSYSVSQDVQVALYNRRVTFDLLPPLFRMRAGNAVAEP